MTPVILRSGTALCAAAVLVFVAFTTAAHAQTVTPPKPETNAEDTVHLNPFEVRAESDTSYGALNSNSITRFNTPLNEVPVSADVFTEDFMRDVATTSVEELLGAYGTAGGIASSAPDSDAASNQPGDRLGNFQLGARGLAAGTVRRDGFVAVGSIANPGSTAVGQTSTFDTERVETIRGPQGLLYGASGAGATVNTVSKQARFDRQSGSLMYRIDQYGSKLGQLDYNWGGKSFAFRISLMDQHQLYRRVFIGSETQGIYTQLAWRLPWHTTVRLEGQKTWSERVNPSNPRLNVSSTNNDPRHNYFFTYLLAAQLAGSTNPATGAAYPVGAVNRGGLTWDNVNSWSGWQNAEWVINQIYSAKVQTEWTPWLSSEVAALYNVYDSDRMNGGQTTDAAPGFQSNPTGDWASAYTPQDNEQPSRHRAIRASIVATNHLFHDRATSQTLIGFDADYAGQGPTNYVWYQADANWQPINTGGTSNLGRVPMGQQWWVVGQRPVKYGLFKPGWATSRVTLNGVNYVRMVQNPRNPAWVTPLNPLGLASAAGFSGIGGSNNKGFVQESNVTGFYGTNYTTWFNGRLGTLLGIRANQTLKRNPNTGSLPSFIDNKKSNQSYNLGVNYEVRKWLRAYYSLSNTYNTPIANANDPLGNLPKTSSGTGQEAGLKFESARAGLSGSMSYFWTNSKDEMINAGTGVRDLINPTGLNGSEPGPGGGRNQWVNLDRTTRGAEMMLTASPIRNWRIRFSGSVADGTNLSNKVYPLLYNDQFYLNASKVVTFKDGTNFLVPTDAATITAQVAKRNAQVDPATLQATGTWAPLTLAMINDPTNPYYANPDNGNGHITGTNLSNALKYFVSPARGAALTGTTGLPLSDMQYTWGDPNHTNGQTTVARKGEPTVGYAQYALSMTQFYTFTGENWLRGVGLGGSVSSGFKYRTYFYASPDGSRRLYSAPNLTTVNGILSYTRKFRRVSWQTQVNVDNVFNHYIVDILPNNGSGFTNGQNLQATFYGQPRTWRWTNTFSF